MKTQEKDRNEINLEINISDSEEYISECLSSKYNLQLFNSRSTEDDLDSEQQVGVYF